MNFLLMVFVVMIQIKDKFCNTVLSFIIKISYCNFAIFKKYIRGTMSTIFLKIQLYDFVLAHQIKKMYQAIQFNL